MKIVTKLNSRASTPDDTNIGDVLEFKRPGKREIEHVDSSMIVERLEFTPVLKAEFEAQGYTFDDGDN